MTSQTANSAHKWILLLTTQDKVTPAQNNSRWKVNLSSQLTAHEQNIPDGGIQNNFDSNQFQSLEFVRKLLQQLTKDLRCAPGERIQAAKRQDCPGQLDISLCDI